MVGWAVRSSSVPLPQQGLHAARPPGGTGHVASSEPPHARGAVHVDVPVPRCRSDRPGWSRPSCDRAGVLRGELRSHRRQDRERPGPPQRALRHPRGDRQRADRARHRHGPRRDRQRHPDPSRPRARAGPHRRRPRRAHLRARPDQRDALVGRARGAARGDGPWDGRRQRPPRVPPGRRRVRRGQRDPRGRPDRHPASARQEGPADLQRPHPRGDLPADRGARDRLRHREADHRDGPDPRARGTRPADRPRRYGPDRPDAGGAARAGAGRRPGPVRGRGDGGGGSSTRSRPSGPT
jgi:hypothetical protein